jgi:hypothetical protein
MQQRGLPLTKLLGPRLGSSLILEEKTTLMYPISGGKKILGSQERLSNREMSKNYKEDVIVR